jgi:DNA/RNA-binding domain of Phe-tRNA-synthetase-like protein
MTIFQYHPEIAERFPTVVGGIIVAEGMKNTPTPEALLKQYEAQQQIIAQRGDGSLSEIPALAAWRTAFRKFGVDPTKYRSASESLIRRVVKKGDIPSINALVDMGNLVSIRYALPIAVVDRSAVQGTITVHFADGSEPYTQLGQDDKDQIPVGEVIFTDETNTVFARRWCWRQSAESAATLDTTDAVITIEAHHAEGRQDVEKAAADLVSLFTEYAGGSYKHAILDANNLSI